MTSMSLKGSISGLKEINVDILWAKFAKVPPLPEWIEKLHLLKVGKEGKLLGDYFIQQSDFQWLNSYRDPSMTLTWTASTLVSEVSFQELAKAIVRLCYDSQ